MINNKLELEFSRIVFLSKENAVEELDSMNNPKRSYLRDKEFGNIMTYEKCLMYGFLFNVTIKINDEFDILQKQLMDIVKNESKLYINLFKSNILK